MSTLNARQLFIKNCFGEIKDLISVGIHIRNRRKRTWQHPKENLIKNRLRTYSYFSLMSLCIPLILYKGGFHFMALVRLKNLKARKQSCIHGVL